MNLIYAGADPKTVQYLAGHKHSKITMDIYAKVKYNKPKELSSVVNKAFAPQKGATPNKTWHGWTDRLTEVRNLKKPSKINAFRP